MANIKGVEIFAEGTWNGNKITAQVLKDIVESFEKTKSFLKPPLKLGHNNEQKLIAKDGLPAAGWVDHVYIKGTKLLADFADIPKKIADMIKKKQYRKVSVEIFSGLKLEGNKFPHLLGGIALLGSDLPAVLTLNDIPTDFTKDGKKGPDFTIDGSLLNMGMNTYTFINDIGEPTMSEKTDKQASNTGSDESSKRLSELVEKQNSVIDELKAQVSDFKKYENETSKKLVELETSKAKAEVEKFTLSLQSQDLASPSMAPYIEALSVEKKEFSIGDKKLQTSQVIEELLKLAKEVYKINKEEKTETGKNKEDENSYKAQNEKIENYALENQVSYSQAYRALQKS